MLIAAAWLGLAAGAATINSSLAGPNPNPGIIPINARHGGLTYGEWLAKLDQWYYSIPAPINPALVGNEQYLSVGQPEELWFLVNVVPVVDRHFTVPAGKALFVTIFTPEWDNTLCVSPPTSYSVDELRALAKANADSLTDIHVDIDGAPVNDVTKYRATSPVFFSTIPDNNLFEALGCSNKAGTYGPMVADGYFLITTPFPPGEHTIHETGVVHVVPGDPTQDVHIDVLWHITVVGGK